MIETEYRLVKQIRENDALRNSFIDLAIETFDLSFKAWYENGFWTDQYLPYVLVENGQVIANASVNKIKTVWQGKQRNYIQIGTVMTKSTHRNRGLSRMLLEEILADWEEQSDAVYLYANDTVLDFYPRFGFERAAEYQYSVPISPRKGDFKKLDMDHAADRKLLESCYLKSNPFSALTADGNYGLLMFYCVSFLKECVFYSKQHDTVCVMEQDGDRLFCYDIFGTSSIDLETLLSELSPAQTREAVLGFTPKQSEGYSCQLIEEDTILFIRSGKENVFQRACVRMPALSHA